MTGCVWVSAHVYRHDDLDDLLVRRVAPLMAELAAERLIDGFFFLRHWEGGPHLRLRMLTGAADAGAVRARVTDGLGRHLREHPSRHPMTADGYARVAALGAALEEHPGYERRLFPPDTIRFVAYPPEHGAFGHGPTLAAVERHFGESAAIAVGTLRLPASRRLSAAMAMTLAALLSLPSGARGPAVPRGAGGSDRAAEAWARSRDELVAVAERLRAAEPPGAADDPVVAWARSLRGLRDRLFALRLGDVLGVQPGDAVAYALDRCLHLHLNRMGVSLRQEARLRRLGRLAVRAVTRA